MSNPYCTWEQNYLDSTNYSKIDFIFEKEMKITPIATNQHHTGRCWMFAALNCMRIPFILYYDLPLNFQFSSNYMFYWDKYERCKYFLETFPKIANSHNPRLRDQLLHKPIIDGGQWNMFVNIVHKHGVMPKESYNETFASNDSSRLNTILNHKVKEAVLRNKSTDIALEEIKDILDIYLGKPPEEFDWNYRSNDSKYHTIRSLTPFLFYNLYVSDHYNVDDYESVINDPRNKYDQYYTVDFLTNMIGTQGPMYYNTDIKTMNKYAEQTLLQNIPVWFGSDVMKYTSCTHCLSGPSFFSDPNQNCLTKKERLQMLDSASTHAMVLHGFSKNREDGIKKWKVENSWGCTGPYNGYYIADNIWFDDYAYQIVVPKTFVQKPKQSMRRAKKLPPWDPFGSFAKSRVKPKLIV